METIKKQLRELTAMPGVSSREDVLIQYMYDGFAAHAQHVQVDPIGNVIAHFSASKPDAKRLMIFGHMDEIGFIVRKVDRNGFLLVERVGGVHNSTLPGTRVDVLGEYGIVPGVIGVKSFHFLKPHEKDALGLPTAAPGTEELYIDIGATSPSHAEKLGVKVGCFLCYHSDFIELADDVVTNKAMDDRVACVILLQLAEQLAKQSELAWDIYLVACVQEEFSVRGIMPAVRRIRPDASIGIDITPACDTPDLVAYSDVVLHGGPALTFMNFSRGPLAGVLPDEKLLHQLIDAAKVSNVPYQREVAVGVITENAFIVFAELGVAVANVSIPTRYTHTPIETVSARDVADAVTLLARFVASLNAQTTFGKTVETSR